MSRVLVVLFLSTVERVEKATNLKKLEEYEQKNGCCWCKRTSNPAKQAEKESLLPSGAPDSGECARAFFSSVERGARSEERPPQACCSAARLLVWLQAGATKKQCRLAPLGAISMIVWRMLLFAFRGARGREVG